jgi:hypothetical protein
MPVSFLSLLTNARDKSTSYFLKKGLFWLTVLEVSDHGHLALLLLDLWQSITSWQGAHGGASCLPQDSQEAKKRKGKDLHSTILFKGTPQ